EGVAVEQQLDKLGQRATDASALALHEGRVPAAGRLGEEGEGFKIAMRTLDLTRPGTAAGAVGVGRAAFEHAVEYAKGRIQFGQPIAANQGVNFLVPDMAAEIEAARLLTWRPQPSPRGEPSAEAHTGWRHLCDETETAPGRFSRARSALPAARLRPSWAPGHGSFPRAPGAGGRPRRACASNEARSDSSS